MRSGGVGFEGQQCDLRNTTEAASQVDSLWILGVDRQRLVVDAFHSPDATKAQLVEQDQIVQSISFVPAS